MKVNAISFKGVHVIGSAQVGDSGFSKKKSEQVNRATNLAKNLEQKGIDTFVLKYSNKDGRGHFTKTSTTYILTNEDARTVKRYDRIKKSFKNLYDFPYYQSDIFVNYFDEMCGKIDEQKKALAEFIATSKTPEK